MSWGYIAVGAGTAIAGYLNSDAAKKSAKGQVKGADAAIAEQRREYDTARSDLAPYRQSGARALDVLNQQLGIAGPGVLSYEDWLKTNPALSIQSTATGSKPDKVRSLTRDLPRQTANIGDVFGLDPFGSKKKKKKAQAAAAAQAEADLEAAKRSGYDAYVQDFNQTHADNPGVDGDLLRDFTIADFENDPGYDFRKKEGIDARNAGFAAGGTYQSGARAKALERFGQDYASGEFSNAYNRFNNDRTTRFNRLASLAGVGQTATNTGVAAGQNTAATISDLTTQRANAVAAGRVGQANAINQGVQTLGNLYLNRAFGGGSSPKMQPKPWNGGLNSQWSEGLNAGYT